MTLTKVTLAFQQIGIRYLLAFMNKIMYCESKLRKTQYADVSYRLFETALLSHLCHNDTRLWHFSLNWYAAMY